MEGIMDDDIVVVKNNLFEIASQVLTVGELLFNLTSEAILDEFLHSLHCINQLLLVIQTMKAGCQK